jgi:hypothetical protein
VVNQPEPEEERSPDKVKEFFAKIAGEDMEVDWMELKEILDYAMRNGNVIWLLQLTLMMCNTGPVHTITTPVFVGVQLHMY